MKLHRCVCSAASIITLLGILSPQGKVMSAPEALTGGPIGFTKHILDDDFEGARSVYAIDLDGDLDVDILAAAEDADEISWWENEGEQGFAKHVVDSFFNRVYSVHAADVDTDGDVDILGAARGADDITWWENDGSENFTEHTIDETFDGASSVYSGDVDGDGDEDVLGTAYDAHAIAWWENDGTESFTKHTIDADFTQATDVYATDIDGDGDVDILGAAQGYGEGELTWWENDGSGSLTEHLINESLSHNCVYATDMDDDGDVDILTTATWSTGINWWENDGNQGFTKHRIEGGFSPSSVYAADLDNDGDIDVLGTSWSDETVSWAENDGDQNFTIHVIEEGFAGVNEVCVADLDGDGDTDVVGAAMIANEIAWWEQRPPLQNVFLPLVLRMPPPPSSAPVLDEISNPDGDSEFTVSWSNVSGATGYDLQEDDNADFSDPTTAYSGPNTSTSVTVVDVGTYYYRVRATNSSGIGPWSSVASVDVTTTLPDVVPEPGTWHCTTAIATVRFTVSSDSSSVSNGYISISCGSKSLAGPAPIEDSSFTLAHSDGFSFISATFDEEDHAEGSYGIWRSGSCWALGTMSCTP